jgi:hypothetical protein
MLDIIQLPCKRISRFPHRWVNARNELLDLFLDLGLNRLVIAIVALAS